MTERDVRLRAADLIEMLVAQIGKPLPLDVEPQSPPTADQTLLHHLSLYEEKDRIVQELRRSAASDHAPQD
jgi:hypothetical protein